MYSKYKSYIAERGWGQLPRFHAFILSIVEESQFKHFYVKDWFSTDGSTVIIIFTENGLYTFWQEAAGFKFKYRKLSDVVGIEYETDSYMERKSILNIVFENRDNVTLDNHVDANENWLSEYHDQIKVIQRYLVNKAP